MAKLVFHSGPYSGKSVTLLAGKSLTLGRNRDIELPLPDPKLSRKHCQIVSQENQCVIRDLSSTNGTFVNGSRLQAEYQLNSFDRIVLGDTELEFLDEAPARITPVTDTPAVQLADKPRGIVSGPASRNLAPQTSSHPIDAGDLLEDAFEEPTEDQDESGGMLVENIVSEDLSAVEEFSEAVATDAEEDSSQQAVFRATMAELSLPLPSEPPPLAQPPANHTSGASGKVPFCDACDASIPLVDWDLNLAGRVDDKIYCCQCLPSVVKPSPKLLAANATAATVNAIVLPQTQADLASKATLQSFQIDAMLAGLDQEAVIVDTTLRRRGQAVTEKEVSKSLQTLESAQQQAVVRNTTPPPAPKVSAPKVAETPKVPVPKMAEALKVPKVTEVIEPPEVLEAEEILEMPEPIEAPLIMADKNKVIDSKPLPLPPAAVEDLSDFPVIDDTEEIL